MTTARISIPNLSSHKPLADAARRREKLRHEVDDLVAEAQRGYASGRMLPDGLANRAQAASRALQVAEMAYQAAQREAQALASDTLKADDRFLALLSDTLAGLCERSGATISYETFRRQAGQAGIRIMLLPTQAEREISEIVAWCKELRRNGYVFDVPQALRPLLNEVPE